MKNLREKLSQEPVLAAVLVVMTVGWTAVIYLLDLPRGWQVYLYSSASIMAVGFAWQGIAAARRAKKAQDAV